MLGVLIVPYGFGRIASPRRCVSVHTLPGAQTAAPPARTDHLRIVCYNIAHGRGLARSNGAGGSRTDRIDRLDLIAELLREIDADIVVLNEVDFDSSWSDSINQAQYLAASAGYAHWAEQRNIDVRLLTWTWRFGNAVLSKHPITHAEVIDLPGRSAWETALAGKKRGLACRIQVGNEEVRVIGAHLSSRSESLRAQSADVLIDIAGGSSIPTIVAGDLNSTPTGFPLSIRDRDGNNAIDTLDASGSFRRSPQYDVLTADDYTFRSDNPRSVIDWILIPPNWRFLEYAVKDSRLSDHRPVFAGIAWD